MSADLPQLLSEIQNLIRSGTYRLSGHAEREREADRITVGEIREALLSPEAEIIEDYLGDSRGHSCLIFGFTAARSPIHVVCSATLEVPLIVITVYRPSADQWVDWRRRRSER